MFVTRLIVTLMFFSVAAYANTEVVPNPKLVYYLVHNGAIPMKCKNGSEGCLYEALGTLEIRFRPKKGVSQQAAWRAVTTAYAGQFYGALEDGACAPGLQEARMFAKDVKETLTAANAPVDAVEVYYHCRVYK